MIALSHIKRVAVSILLLLLFLDGRGYDHAGRLNWVKHSVNGATPIVLFENQYNELGQLVTKKLHSTTEAATDARQTIDYRYNIRGWLTTMNDVANPDATDLFSMSLNYNTPTIHGGVAQYNGNISEILWRGADAKTNSYGYSYDPMNRLIEAQYYNTTDPSRNGRYNEKIWDVANNKSGYDLNGNIKFLSRTGKSGLNTLGITTYGQMDKLAYTYTGNQLQAVTETGVKTEGFIEGTNTGNDYQYDANGNMNLDQNKTIQTITYNHLNLPDRVTKTSGDYIQYQYDATGRKLNQLVYNPNNVLQKKTDYAGEFFYEDNVLKFINHEEGRIVMTGAAPEYQYHLKDHLGNVRVTFTTKDEQEENTATLEDANANDERVEFLRYDNARRVTHYLFDHTRGSSPTTTNGTAQRLSGQGNEIYGLAKSLSVMPGDVIDMEVYAKYVDSNSTNRTTALTTLISQIASGTATAGTVIDGSSYGTSTSTFPFPGGLNGTGSSAGDGPKAYLNWLVFDRDYNLILGKSGYTRMTTDARETGQDVAHEKLTGTVTIGEAGYVYIYFSNEEGAGASETYWDDLKVTHIKSAVVAGNDYYPFGLSFNNSYARENSLKQDYLYNGKELQDELSLGLLDYGPRMYMPDLGRFNEIDIFSNMSESYSPYSYVENDPVNFIDIGGNFKFSDDFRSKYPRVTAWLEEVLPLLQYNQHIINTIDKNTHLGKDVIKSDFKNGNGPTLDLLEPFDSDAWGRTQGIGMIRINQGNLIDLLERGLASGDSQWKNFNDEHKFMTVVTILHELIHEGALRTKFKRPVGIHYDNPNQDEGDNWEIDAFGRQLDRISKAGGKDDNPRRKETVESFREDSPIFFYLFINTTPSGESKKKQTYFKGTKGHGEW